jgi:hypothetical protein
MRSPLNRISGTWNGLLFEGDAYLTIFDAPSVSVFGTDSWIVRANIASLNFTGLNLFIYRPPGATTPPSLIPPEHNINRFDFQYTIGFTDESFIAAPLTHLSIVSVPESEWLLAIGLLTLISFRSASSVRVQLKH